MEWLLENEKDPVLGEHLGEILGDLSIIPYNTVAGWYRWYYGEDDTRGFPYGQDCVGKLSLMMEGLQLRGLYPDTYFIKSHSVVAGLQSPVEHFVAIVGGYIADPFAYQVEPIHLSDLEAYGSILTQGAVARRGFGAVMNSDGTFSTSIYITPENYSPRTLITNNYQPQELLDSLPNPQDYVRFNVPFELHIVLDGQSPYKIRVETKGGVRGLRVFYNCDNTFKTDQEVEARLREYYGIDFPQLTEYFSCADSLRRLIDYWLQKGVI